MTKKCPRCYSCLKYIWILPNRYLFCDFCKDFYDIINNQLVRLDKVKILTAESLGVQEIKKD